MPFELPGGDRWEVHVVAPTYFHGKNDIRPATFVRSPSELCPVEGVHSYLTQFVHVFAYGWPSLRKALSGSWDIVHAWEEPYILAGAELAACVPRRARFVFRTAQSLNKWYPPPFNCFERYVLRRAAGWICSGQLVAANLAKRRGYAKRPWQEFPLELIRRSSVQTRPRGVRSVNRWNGMSMVLRLSVTSAASSWRRAFAL